MKAARRAASWYRKPGRGAKYHVAMDDWLPACNRSNSMRTGMILADFTAQDAASVPQFLRCQRPGCRAKWATL